MALLSFSNFSRNAQHNALKVAIRLRHTIKANISVYREVLRFSKEHNSVIIFVLLLCTFCFLQAVPNDVELRLNSPQFKTQFIEPSFPSFRLSSFSMTILLDLKFEPKLPSCHFPIFLSILTIML